MSNSVAVIVMKDNKFLIGSETSNLINFKIKFKYFNRAKFDYIFLEDAKNKVINLFSNINIFNNLYYNKTPLAIFNYTMYNLLELQKINMSEVKNKEDAHKIFLERAKLLSKFLSCFIKKNKFITKINYDQIVIDNEYYNVRFRYIPLINKKLGIIKGKIEPYDKTPEDAILRELEEETNINREIINNSINKNCFKKIKQEIQIGNTNFLIYIFNTNKFNINNLINNIILNKNNSNQGELMNLKFISIDYLLKNNHKFNIATKKIMNIFQ